MAVTNFAKVKEYNFLIKTQYENKNHNSTSITTPLVSALSGGTTQPLRKLQKPIQAQGSGHSQSS